MTDLTKTGSSTALALPKLTAACIEQDCPVRLRKIGIEITKRLTEAREQTKLVDHHVIAINALIAEAKDLCDNGGFEKFRELFCPQLGKSQAYVRLAIANGKTTLVEQRAKERERKQKTRATQKAAVADSGTVPENADPETEAQNAGIRYDEPATATSAPEQLVPPAKLSSGGTHDAVSGFNSHVMELNRRISSHNVERFVATDVPADILAKIGKFLSDLAVLKKSDAAPRRPDGAVPARQTVQKLKVEPTASDTELEARLDAQRPYSAPEARQ